MNRASILLLAGMAFLSDLALSESETSRKSPYFIDGIHCEGLEGVLEEDKLRTHYPSEEVAEVGLKTIRQNYCENIFRAYGIEKFQWVTPEDLEKLSFAMKRSQKFEKVDIRIEKSELQNHVHLIGVFKTFVPKNRYSLNLKTAIENGQDAGNRTSSSAQASMHFGQQGQNNPAPYVLGIKYLSSNAARALNSEELRQNNKNVEMTEEEEISQARQNGYYGGVDFKINLPFSSSYRGIQPYLIVGLHQTKLTGDESPTLNNSFELGTEFQEDPLIPAKTRLSLLYAAYAATGSEFHTSSDSEKSKDRSVLFAGISQELKTQTLSGNLRLYRALKSELQYFGDIDLLLHLREFAGVKNGLGIEHSMIRGAVLPEHRLGLPDSDTFRLFYRAETAVTAWGVDNKISLKLGTASYEAVNNLDNSYSRDAVFGEVGLTRQTDDFDLGLAFVYGSQRLY